MCWAGLFSPASRQVLCRGNFPPRRTCVARLRSSSATSTQSLKPGGWPWPQNRSLREQMGPPTALQSCRQGLAISSPAQMRCSPGTGARRRHKGPCSAQQGRQSEMTEKRYALWRPASPRTEAHICRDILFVSWRSDCWREKFRCHQSPLHFDSIARNVRSALVADADRHARRSIGRLAFFH